MDSLYTTSVSNVPPSYNDPTAAYKKHVWIAVAGIFAFFGFYLFLTYLFFSSAYRLLFDAFGGGNSSLITTGVGVASLFLGVFMIKSFFFVQTKYDVKDRQVIPEDEPVLFDYLHKLADEIGAPRPSKVYLSNRVNASVFYDLSFLNLFFPSKKNLEIGLGLINILNLGEFKAVLAHEYGHFAQKSMLVGRWVYIANQIANAIINRRDALDSLLSGLSRIDIRIAWIGWILSIIVWSIRSLVELIFRIVVLSQRALSREMEFQADLVSVSVTGSDALIHALHKLQAADAGLSDAMNALSEQLGKGKAIEDLYSIQTNSVDKTAYILNDDDYGKSPKVSEVDPENHRVFTDKIAQPPKMWLTHPPDQEREANAKRNYISGHIDDRSAWDLFSDPSAIRLLMTKDLVDSTKVKTDLLSTTEALSFHNKQFDKSYFNPSYRGVYLKRFFCQDYQSSEEIYLTDMSLSDAAEKIDVLYPQTLVEELEDFTTLQEEFVQLKAIKDKKLTAAGEGGIWHRGTQIRRRELPNVIDGIKSEVDQAKKRVTNHDRLARTVHLKLAESIGHGWDDYLKGLLSIIHYSEHNISNIRDAHYNLGLVLNVIMADNKVSDSERRKLILQCDDVYGALVSVAIAGKTNITMDEGLINELNLDEGEELIEEFKFPRANDNNLTDWVNNIGGWVGSYDYSLTKLRSEALELLLKTESKVKEMYQSQQIVAAPPASVIEGKYKTLRPGEERSPSMKLSLWDKFISADGIVPAATKFVVASSIVGSTLYYTGHSGLSDLSIYNGLGQTVVVDLDGTNVQVEPFGHVKTDFTGSEDYVISASTLGGDKIEAFNPELSQASGHYVYNVARAAALMEYRVYYGGTPGDHRKILGNPRWSKTRVDHIFEEPPEQIKSKKSGSTRDVLMGIAGTDAISVFSLSADEESQTEFIKSHALWDPSDSPNALQWLSVASSRDDAIELLRGRLDKYPDDIVTLRMLMDNNDDDRQKVCEEYTAKSVSDPSNPDAYYITTRCITDEDKKAVKYIDGASKWPDHEWMNYAASHYHAHLEDWESAYNALLNAYDNGSGLKPVIGMNARRIQRYAEATGVTLPEVRDLQSQYLDQFDALESGDETNPYVHVHYLINNGSLEEAMETAKNIDDIRASTIAICAASDGGKRAWQDIAINYPPDSLSSLGAISTAGLRLRRNLSITDFVDHLDDKAGSEDFSVVTFLDYVKSHNYVSAEKLLNNIAISTGAEMYALAYIAYGDRIPQKWKLKAKHMLFASEKPYIE